MAETCVSHLIFFVNGTKVSVASPKLEDTLLKYLRRNLYLTGTKEACGQGSCGACTVMLSSYDCNTKKISHISVNACLMPLCYLHGMAVTTVEGVGSTKTGLHFVQKSLVESHGMQCGFCTPGMVMTMYTLLRNNPSPPQHLMERVLEGNLCRCTGYRPIVDAFKQAKENCPCGLGLCLEKNSGTEDNSSQAPDETNDEKKRNPTQDVIFPAELQLNKIYHEENLKFSDGKFTWFRPASLADLVRLKRKYPDAPLVMGCNSIGYLLRTGKLESNVIICGTNVSELKQIEVGDSGVKIGAGITFHDLEIRLQEICNEIKDPKNRSLDAIVKVLRWLAVDQIRNTATIGGHVMSKAPDFDLQVLLMAAGASLNFITGDDGPVFANKTGMECKMDNSFYTEVKDKLSSSEILAYITLPFTTKNEYICGTKQPHRRGYDYGIVTSGLYVRFEDNAEVVLEMRLSFGGIDTKPSLAKQAGQCAIKKSWNEDIVPSVCDAIIEDFKNCNHSDIKFRMALACSFFFRFYQQVKCDLQKNTINDKSGLSELCYPESSGVQLFDVPDNDGNFVAWKPIPNVTSEYIATGEALFIDDIPKYQNELFVAPVTSTHAHARILSVDTSEALAVPGVIDFITHSDVTNNNYGLVVQDSLLFAVDEVFFYGQPIGAILAEDRATAFKAAALVKVQYEEMDAIFTIEEAIENSSFFPMTSKVLQGDIDKAKAEAELSVEGEVEIGSQEHLYFETQTALIVPKKEQNEVEAFVSTQFLANTQKALANFVGIPSNRVVAKVKRAGGAFGGKGTDSFLPAGMAIVGAWKHGRPVRAVLSRKDDMLITGKRHPTKAKYKVFFDRTGKLIGLDMDYYLNCGWSVDLSPGVMVKSHFYVHGGYNIPNIHVRNHLCKTNISSRTGFRGFGGPQMLFTSEQIIQHVAEYLQMSPVKLKEINLIGKGDTTACKKTLEDENLKRCWEECLELSQYEERTKEIAKYNSESRWKKRGMAISPLLYPIGYPGLEMNQGGALLQVYLDGSILLAHGGVEMGQGLNTKCIQVAATALGVPKERIITSETSTATVPNTTPTSGSHSSDLQAGAVLVACQTLNERLEPIKKMKPDGTWEEWIKMAYGNRISLNVTGFYKTSREQGFDFATGEGDHCSYFTFGVACCETEIDCLTGEHQVRRTDIVMDVGKSLNPAIDIGQIEGGFVQGYGMMTMEQLDYNQEGRLISTGPHHYKIPCVRNIPRDFRVKLLKDSECPKAVYSSKGIGEPALLLAVTAHLAIKEAIKSARKDAGQEEYFFLKCPATVERIRMACQDTILEKCASVDLPTFEKPKVSMII